MADPITIDDFRVLARERLPLAISDYIDGGAGDEITVGSNRRDFDGVALLPLCLRDVSEPDLSVSLLGEFFQFPIGFSPTAFHRLADKGGEISTASAARALRVPMTVSSMSSITLEEVAAGSGNENLWLQTYLFKDRGVTKDLIQRAEAAGYQAIVLTVGCPVVGNRPKNMRNRFTLPDDVSAANFRRRDATNHNNPIHSISGAEIDPSATWHDVELIRRETKLPIILKGIMNPLDVAPALDLEVAALILSNHGGRQLDTTRSTISALPEVAEALSGRVPLLVDSGFRRGTDILKAIALGADAVLLGRPVLWALAVGGESGVVRAVDLLVEELRTAMQIVGCASLDELRSKATSIIRR
jgi:isopentenyl diphosphate isomerase/L-lactate dehydrogenase-like FMN-dependent dehydrogenase